MVLRQQLWQSPPRVLAGLSFSPSRSETKQSKSSPKRTINAVLEKCSFHLESFLSQRYLFFYIKCGLWYYSQYTAHEDFLCQNKHVTNRHTKFRIVHNFAKGTCVLLSLGTCWRSVRPPGLHGQGEEQINHIRVTLFWVSPARGDFYFGNVSLLSPNLPPFANAWWDLQHRALFCALKFDLFMLEKAIYWFQ